MAVNPRHNHRKIMEEFGADDHGPKGVLVSNEVILDIRVHIRVDNSIGIYSLLYLRYVADYNDHQGVILFDKTGHVKLSWVQRTYIENKKIVIY